MAVTTLTRGVQASGRFSQLIRPSSTPFIVRSTSASMLTKREKIDGWSSILCSLFHSYRLTNNLSIFSEQKLEKPKALEIATQSSKARPLILFFSWLKATEKNSARYIELYTNLGYEVLRVAINPSDLWQPVNRMQVIAKDVTDFLEINQMYKQIMVHGMSVGAYAYCEIMARMVEDRARYQPFLDRFVGQIWDSPVDVHSAPIGTSKSVTENPYLQKLIQKFCKYIMEWKHDDITFYYYKAHDGFHGSFVDIPALFLVSKIDPVSDLSTNEIIANKWIARGNDVKIVCFEDSPHVLHFKYNKEEYERESMQFLRKVVTLSPLPAPVPQESMIPTKHGVALQMA